MSLSTIRPSSAQSGRLWALRTAFLLMGFTFSVTQAVMLRAFLVAFSGNELSIGLVLAGWLILEAVGSGLLGRLADRPALRRILTRFLLPLEGVGEGPRAFALLQLILALMLPLSLYAAFTVRRLVGVIPGVGVDLGTMAWASWLILAPLGLVDGVMFTCGCRAYARLQGETGSAGRVYSLEALGGIAGGLLLTYVFIPYLDALQIVLVLVTLNIASATSLVAWAARGSRLRCVCGPLLALLTVAAYLLFFQSGGLQQGLCRQQWPGYELLFCDESIYGKVTVICREN